MFITCTKENLIKGLSAIEHAIGRNTTLPVLSHVAFQTQTGKITLSATDLDIAVVFSIPAKTDSNDAWTVPLRLFSGFIQSLPDGPIQIKKTGKQLGVKTGTFQGKFQCGMIEDFPIIPNLLKIDSIRLESESFTQALEDVLVAVAVTDTRPELTGVAITTENNTMSVAATDTFRLAVRTLAYEGTDPISIILPQRSAQEVSRLFKNAEIFEIRFSENQCMFSTRDVALTSRLIEGSFPDYRAIIPKSAVAKLRIPRSETAAKIEAASFFTGRLNDVALQVKKNGDAIILYAENPEVGEYTAEIKSEDGKGEEQKASFNLRYLLDGIRNIRTDEVNLEVNGEAKPLVLRSGSEQNQSNCYLLMPVRSS